MIPSDFITFVCTKLLNVNKSKSNIEKFIFIIKKQVSTSVLITFDTDCFKVKVDINTSVPKRNTHIIGSLHKNFHNQFAPV